MIKTLDKYILKSFVAPFLGTFFIALFVLVMQTLWVYIDDIAGKGVGILILIELVSYMSVSMFPMALPVAVLLSSVMVMGNLAERYELATMKASGISLARIMASLIFMTLLISLFSFYCANTLIPISNLKFQSRLHDISKQKATLNLKAGEFNTDFKGYVLRIGDKDQDGRTIKDVLVYDHTEDNRGRLALVTAKTGEMFITPDEQHFVMRLKDGTQYSEFENKKKEGRMERPFSRVHFKEFIKIFDLSQFNLNRTEEDRFKKHYRMLSVTELTSAIDSLDSKKEDRLDELEQSSGRFITALLSDSTLQYRQNQAAESRLKVAKLDSARMAQFTQPMEQLQAGNLTGMTSIIESFPQANRLELLEKAGTLSHSFKGQIEAAYRSRDRLDYSRVKHLFELHNKFSLPLACLLFLFIGAPMGAIIRKGGFGYPLLVSVFFFTGFIVLNILGKNLSEEFKIEPWLASWGADLLLFPVGLLLTYKAMNDSQLFQIDRYIEFFKRLISFKSKTSA